MVHLPPLRMDGATCDCRSGAHRLVYLPQVCMDRGSQMKEAISLAACALLLVLFFAALPPLPKARCAYCYVGECYNSSMCGDGCTCLKRGLDLQGYCYSGE